MSELTVTARTLQRSIASRLTYSTRAERGIVPNPNIAQRVRQDTGIDE